MDWIIVAVKGGGTGLASYLAAHVLLCLVPAFFIAGALSALVPQQSIVRFLGPRAPRWIAYPAAAGAGSLLAVCSCTVQPLFAGIYKKGAGLGPAITFLFFAPAANILALSYTGVALGADFMIARVLLALSFGIGIGMIMALLFRAADEQRSVDAKAFEGGAGMPGRAIVFIAALVALLLAGTLKLDILEAGLARAELPWTGAAPIQSALDRWVPVDAASGAEGLTLQGAVLLGLLAVIGALAWRGARALDEGLNAPTRAALSIAALALVLAAAGVTAGERGLTVTLTGRAVAVAVLAGSLLPLARRLEAWDVQQWLAETWRFVCLIFPLLVAGVFLVGAARAFIEPDWIRAIAGANTLAANLAGVAFGVFMYFPTLVEVPVAKMFLSLGMHPGPLIAYLMADPELSLQSILITGAIIGKLRAWTYVGLVAVFATAAGLLYGAWVDGAAPWQLAVGVIGFVGIVVALLHALEAARARRRSIA